MRKARVRVPACEGVMREGVQAEASMKNVRSMGEGNEKEESDERKKGQIEKKPPCFCPFVYKVEK